MASPYQRRDIRGGAAATTITSGILSGDSTFTLASSAGWPDGGAGDFFVVFDRGNVGEEKVRCASRSSLTVTVQTSGRGSDGTSASAHASGVTVQPCGTATDDDEANYTVSKTVGKIAAQGDILVGDAANSLAKLAKGTSGYPLVAGASTLSYAQLGTGGIANNAITSGLIATDAVGSAQIATDAVGSAEIAAGAVGTSELAALAVTTAKIAAANVTEVELAASVAGNGLAGGAGSALSVGVDGSTVELNADAVRVKDAGITGAKLNSNVVDNSTLALSGSQLLVKDAGLTSAKFNSEAGTAWTPTVSGTGWALVNGTVTGLYLKHGRLVHAQAIITFGSSSTFGSGSLTIGGLPVTMNASIGGTGRVFISDASASTDYYADWQVNASASSGVIYATEVFTTPAYAFRIAVVQGVPMTWANGDSLTITMSYIAVS